LVRGEKPKWRKEWFYSHLFPGMPPAVRIPRSEGLRTERWKYLRWIDENPLREEVYDLRKDPEELVNLSHTAARPRLASRWKAWRDAVNSWRADRPWQDPV
jgi:arylsulfatase A-like enzyme